MMKTIFCSDRTAGWPAMNSLAITALFAAVLAVGGCTGDDGGTTTDSGGGADVGALGDGEGEGDSAAAVDVAVDVGAEADAGGCKADKDCEGRDDANACNGVYYCEKSTGKCEKTAAVSCSSAGDDACNANVCVPATGDCKMLPKPKGTKCDDGEACTEDDGCENGVCVGGKSVCECQNQADCDKKDDGDLCNGTLFCDKQALPWKCALNPASIVQCDKTKDTECVKTACAPKTGKCSKDAVKAGSPCEWDGNACTLDECHEGECTQGKLAKGCDCKTDSDCAKLEDGNLCNGTLYCSLATKSCALNPATIVHCQTSGDKSCSTASCVPKTGQCELTVVKDGTLCADGRPCTSKEACKGGKCEPVELSCGCSETADCAAFEDEDKCNGSLYCSKALAKCITNPATVKECETPEGQACITSECESKTGKCVNKPANDGAVCESDGTLCTGLDLCKGGKCEQGDAKCDCTADADCDAFEDNNLCNGTLFCDKAKKKCLVLPSSVITCSGGEECNLNTCEPKTGKCAPKVSKDGAKCDADGFVCTADTCSKGKCEAGPNQCLCNADQECQQWEDGNACNGTLKCDQQAKPAPGCVVDKATVVHCPTDLPGECTASFCNPANGKCFVGPGDNGKACDDGLFCTEGDSCTAGSCGGLPSPATKTCDDTNACTEKDHCEGGKCKAGAPIPCDDKISCTVDACDPKSGCTFTANHTACDDAVPCTDDTCDPKSGCQSKTDDDKCDDKVPCTTDSCDLKAGCKATADDAKCSDGNACNGAETCDAKAGCKAGAAPKCDDGNSCTDDSCDPKSGCKQVNNTKPCSDNVNCTVGDACKDGACKAGPQALRSLALAPGFLFDAKLSSTGKLIAVGGQGTSASTQMAVQILDLKAGTSVGKALGQGAKGTRLRGLSEVGGAWMAVGQLGEDKIAKAYALTFDEKGTLISGHQDTANGTHAFHDVIGFGSTAVAVGWSKGQEFESALIAALDSKGKVTKREVAGNDGASSLHAVDATSAGRLTAVGTDKSEGTALLVVIADSAGKILHQRIHGQLASSQGLAVLGLSDGTAIVGGAHSVQGKTRGFLGRFDNKGGAIFTKALGGVGSSQVLGLGWANGRVAVVEQDIQAKVTDAHITFFDLSGKVSEDPVKIQFGSLPVANALAVVAHSNGVAVVGSGNEVGKEQGQQVALLGFHGHGSCAAAGGCYDLAKKCLGTNTCRKYSCDPKAGCTNLAHPFGSVCDDGSACTKGDKCATGAKCSGASKLWAAKAADLTGLQLQSLAPIGTSYVTVVGAKANKQGTDLPTFITFDAGDGSKKFERSLGQFGGVAVHVVPSTFNTALFCGAEQGDGLIGRLWENFVLNNTGKSVSIGAGVLTGVAYQGGLRIAVGYTLNGQTMAPEKAVLATSNNMTTFNLQRQLDGVGIFHRVVTTSAGYVVSAVRVANDKAYPGIVRLNSKGDVQSAVFRTTKEGQFHDLVKVSDQLIYGVGQFGDGDKATSLVARIGGGGEWLHSVPHTATFSSTVYRAAAVDEQGYLLTVGGWGKNVDDKLTDSTAAFALLDQYGGRARISDGGTAKTIATAVAWLPELGWVVGGFSKSTGGNKAFLRTFDGHLNAACSASGACFTKQRGDCDDGKPCTNDYCTLSACKVVPIPTGGACEDGNPCKLASCDKGSCTGTLEASACDDKNPCTDDACDPKASCKHIALSAVACNDGDACTTYDRCAAGKCVSSKAFWTTAVSAVGGKPLSDPGVHGIAVDSIGRAFFAGYENSNGLVGLVSQSGAVVFLKTWNKGGAEASDQFSAAAVGHSADEWVSVGSAGSEVTNGYFVRWDSTGKLLAEQKHSLGFGTSFSAMAKTNDGYMVVGSVNVIQKGQHALLVRLDKEGKALWNKQVKGSGDTFANAIALSADGKSFGIGANTFSFGQGFQINRVFIHQADDSSKSPELKEDTSSQKLTPSVVLPRSNGWTLLQRLNQLESNTPYYEAVNAAGTTIGGYELDKTWSGFIQAAMPTVNDGAFFVGRKGTLANEDAIIGGIDQAGNVLWSKSFAGSANKNDRMSAVAAAGEGVIVGGVLENSNGKIITLRRVSWWGDIACQAAGQCAGLLPTKCDDGDECTQSTCTPSKGCEHKTWSAGVKRCEFSGKIGLSWSCNPQSDKCEVSG